MIDPDATLAALDAFAERLARAAQDRIPVLLGTGHPHRLLRFLRRFGGGPVGGGM